MSDFITIFKSASEYDKFHYERGYDPNFYNNVSIFAITLEKYTTMDKTSTEFITFSGDVKNFNLGYILGYGKTPKESKEHFIAQIYDNIYTKIGGIYLLSSKLEYHEYIMKSLFPPYTYASINYVEDIILNSTCPLGLPTQ